jgi:Zinc-finger of C2H2 type
MSQTSSDKTSSSSSNSSNEQKDWIDLLNESVHTNDDIDIGDIYAVSRNFVVVMRGMINVHYYYIPVNKVEGWDGNVLWLKVTEKHVKENYERNILPDPKQYYIKNYPDYDTSLVGYFYSVPVIPSKYTDQSQYIKETTPPENVPRIYKCDLCNEVFNSDNDLDKHMDIAKH